MEKANILDKKGVVEFFMKKEILLTPDILEKLEDSDTLTEISKNITELGDKPLILDQEIKKIVESGKGDNLNWEELEKSKVQLERGDGVVYEKFKSHVSDLNKKETTINGESEAVSSVKPLSNFNENSGKKTIENFIDHYNNRHKKMEDILRNRPELGQVQSINRLTSRAGQREVTIIGMVSEIQLTKNGNLILNLEDPTGQIKGIIIKSKSELFRFAKELVLDEVIGVIGSLVGDVMFVNKFVWPDIPVGGEIKRAEEESQIAFISDLHVGSDHFLPDDFDRFIKWTQRKLGNEAQRNISKNLKYIVISGDLVDGCGIYPGQENELAIPDLKEQYEECSRLLKQIPKEINLIICPGNHDAVRLGEPQPIFSGEYTKHLMDIPNATFVSNPSLVNLGSRGDFSGFDILVYHGASFDHYVREVESLRNQGGYDRADLIMQFLLKRRHLAPTHSSASFVPGEKDYLVIEKAPDFFISGHIHKSVVANYRETTLVCGSCWQSKTKFQEKVGHNPEPSRVPVANTKTREVKILKFGN